MAVPRSVTKWYRIAGTTLELRDRAGEALIRMEAVTPR